MNNDNTNTVVESLEDAANNWYYEIFEKRSTTSLPQAFAKGANWHKEQTETENQLLRLFHSNTIEAMETLVKAMESENGFDREWWAIKTRQLIGNAKSILK